MKRGWHLADPFFCSNVKVLLKYFFIQKRYVVLHYKQIIIIMKLAEPWWDEMRNTITGFKAGSHDIRGAHKTSDEVRYFNAYPTLEIKSK